MAKESLKVVATNRSARHDFFIDDVFEAGIVLTGTEVKALRMGRATIGDGYVYIEGGEAWLDNIHIPEYTQGTWTNHAPRRARRQELFPANHRSTPAPPTRARRSRTSGTSTRGTSR